MQFLKYLVIVLFNYLTFSFSFEFKHHNNQELYQVLDSVHKKCPNITRIYTLSESSVLGVPLYFIEFSTQVGQHVPRKLFFFLKNSPSNCPG